MSNKINPFKLSEKERLIEVVAILIFLFIFVGSFLKLLFF
jgi:hypothetical protein